MTSLIVGIVLIVGGLAFAAAPLFRRPDGEASADVPPPAPPPDAASAGNPAAASMPPADPSVVADLEELELDRAMGKLSDADYAALRAGLEARLARARGGAAPGGGAPDAAPVRPAASESAPDGAPPADASATGPVATGTPGAPLPARAAVSTVPPRTAAPDVPSRRDGDDLDADIERRVRSARALVVVCARCGPRPEPAARFCSTCGTVLGGCPACGRAPLPTGARFCDRCGSALAAER